MINNNFLNFFGKVGGVKRHPYNKNIMSKFVSRPFRRLYTISYFFFKKSVLGNNRGMHSLMTSRNRLLGGLLEHAPGQAFGTYSGTLLES